MSFSVDTDRSHSTIQSAGRFFLSIRIVSVVDQRLELLLHLPYSFALRLVLGSITVHGSRAGERNLRNLNGDNHLGMSVC